MSVVTFSILYVIKVNIYQYKGNLFLMDAKRK